MATTTVNASYEGTVDKLAAAATVNWLSDVRNAVTGTSATTFDSVGEDRSSGLPGISYDSGKTGQVGDCSRGYFFFDVSGVGGTITAATLKIYGALTTNSVDTILVKATAWGTSGGTSTVSTGDYDAIDFNTNYSNALTSWTTSTYNNYTLNATSISDMNTNGYLNLAILNYDYDYSGVGPSLGTSQNVGIRFYSTNRNKLEITYTPSGGIGEVMGVALASIAEISGATSIGEVNGVG